MKKSFLLLGAVIYGTACYSQNVGVDVANPVQKLDVAGGIKIGNTTNNVAGSLRWNGTAFQFYDGSQWITLGANTDDQRIDQFSLVGNSLQLSIEDDGQGPLSVDLSSYLDNTDDQRFDVVQLTGNNLMLSIENDGQPTHSIDFSGYLDNTDDQKIDAFSIASGNLLQISIEDDGQAPLTVDLSSYLDNTDDQRFDVVQMSGNSLLLSIENDGQATHSIDFSGYLDNTDDQQIDAFTIAPGNLLQISIEADGVGPLSVDLSPYLDDTDDQRFDVVQLSGNNLLLSIQDDGQPTHSIDLSGYLDNTDDQQISNFSLSGTTLTLEIENDGQLPQTVNLDPLRRQLIDADLDTWIRVAQDNGSDNDIIRMSTNATERLRVTAAGNLGIGTTTPGTKLTVAGTNTDAVSILGLTSGNDLTTFNDGAQIAFGYNGTHSYQHFVHTRHNSGGAANNAMDFYVSNGVVGNNTVTNGSTHAMTLNAGNMGVGTTSPAQKLHVLGTGRFSSLASSGNDLVYANANGDLVVSSIDPASIHSGTGTANYLARWTSATALGTGTTYDNGTNVGLGTTSPAFKLHVTGDIHPDGKFVVQNSVDGGNSRGIWMWNAGDSNWGIYMGQSGGGRSLGGGTAAAGAGFSAHAIRFRVANSSSQGFIFENSLESNLFSLRGSDGLAYFAGSMGVGTTSPAEKLHVNGSLRVEDGTINSGSDNIRLMEGVRANDNSYEWVGYYSGTTRQGIILYDGAWSGANGLTNEFSITAENSNLLTLNTNGNHIALMPDGSGNVGVSTTSPSQKLDVNGAIRSTDYHYINHSSPSIIFQDTDHRSGVIHVNSNLMYFLSGNGTNGTSWSSNGSYWPLTINMTNDEAIFGGPVQLREGDLTANDHDIWDVENLTVNTISDGEDSRIDIRDYVWFDNPAGAQDMWFDSYANEPHLRPGSAGWGYLGRVQNWWRYVYATSHITMSQRSLKRDINPLDENRAVQELIVSDIDRLRPSLYKYNNETDDLESGNETSYRPQYHLGFILDETPDYIQDNEFGGVDNYALASMSMVGVKQNREDIKALKEGRGLSKISDFGSTVITEETLWVDFDPEFSSLLTNGELPVVNITAHEMGAELALVEKTALGFRVKRLGTQPLGIEWIANAKVRSAAQVAGQDAVGGSIPQDMMNQLAVPQAAKDKIALIREVDKNIHQKLGVTE